MSGTKIFSWVVTPTPRHVCDGEKDPTRYAMEKLAKIVSL